MPEIQWENGKYTTALITRDGHIAVEDVRRIDLKPGQVLVFTMPGPITREQGEDIRDQVKSKLPDGAEVLIVPPGTRLDVVDATQFVA